MPVTPDPTPDPADAPEASEDLREPSKSRRKKDMHALQALGVQLVRLDPARLRALDLPERLADAIAQARSITKHEARRRQMQFVGRLMRDVDPEPIRATLERLQAIPRAERALFAAAEGWRDRLLADDVAVAEFKTAFPDADPVEIAELVKEARAERASGRPPHKYRALFRQVSRHVTK